MTIRTKLTIGGTEYTDYQTMNVTKTVGDANASSSFDAVLDSPFGRHKNDFTVGSEVILYADKDTTPTDILFRGILEEIRFQGEGTTQTVELTGRDYGLRLLDLTVQPIVFTNTEISAIVKNILSNNGVPDITTNNVQTTGVTLPRIGYNHTPIFDAIKQLADLANYIFYVDNNKDLHFEPFATTDSGVTLDNSNIITCDFDKSRQGMANQIWVYGDRYLVQAPTEIFKFGSPTGMSGVTLAYKPHNTQISYLGSILRGSIQGLTSIPTSGDDYGVSYDDRTINFYSGTSLGYSSIPVSGGSAVCIYDRDKPIVKYGQNDLSIQIYGPKTLKIQDNTIKDPQTAVSILKQNLQNVDPLDRIKVYYKGWNSFIPGNTVTLVLDNFNLNESVNIVQLDYKFDKNTIQSEKVINLVLSVKYLDITDKIKEMQRKIDLLESQNLQNSDIYTRLFTNTGSMMIIGSRWNVYGQTLTGSCLCCASPGLPVPINLIGTLASGTNQKGLAGTPNGSAFTPITLLASGLYYSGGGSHKFHILW